MPFILVYLIKLSISLAVVFMFYHFILRKLTFYSHNRWYLLGYSLISFFIPLVNISPALHRNELADSHVINWIPLIYQSSNEATAGNGFALWNITAAVVVSGMIFMLFRLLLQLFSFRKMMKKSTLIASKQVNIYQVDGKVIPFSFGNSVFINPRLHTPDELEEIIRHEFVHVKQLHSLDILFSELLCLLNWYNPFAWFIRSSIRQNLEFIADSKVLEKGANKRQYQYLLLKVTGNNQFNIAPKFNFSSLKKRIAMMNKLQSAKVNLLRFLFILPLLAVILVSFRNEIGDRLLNKNNRFKAPVPVTDTIPEVSAVNDKGYYIDIKDKKGECELVIKDQNKKEVKRLLLTDWNKNKVFYEKQYGQILPPPPPPPPADAVAPVAEVKMSPPAPEPPAAPSVAHLPKNITSVQVSNNKITVKLKNGQVENYDKNDPGEMKTFESRYGQILPPPPPPPAKSGKLIEGKTTSGTEKTIYEEKKIPGNVLFVLDGVITDKSTVNSLDPSRIESIDVLKGPDAEAIFGEKGRNGVIKIKTKKPASASPAQTGLDNLFFLKKDDGC